MKIFPATAMTTSRDCKSGELIKPSWDGASLGLIATQNNAKFAILFSTSYATRKYPISNEHRKCLNFGKNFNIELLDPVLVTSHGDRCNPGEILISESGRLMKLECLLHEDLYLDLDSWEIHNIEIIQYQATYRNWRITLPYRNLDKELFRFESSATVSR